MPSNGLKLNCKKLGYPVKIMIEWQESNIQLLEYYYHAWILLQPSSSWSLNVVISFNLDYNKIQKV